MARFSFASFLLFLQAFQNNLVPVRAVMQAALDTADGRGARARARHDVVVGMPRVQHTSHFQTLRQSFQLTDGADILEKLIAFLHAAKKKHSLAKLIRQIILQFWINHNNTAQLYSFSL